MEDMTRTYRTRGETVQAVQWTGDNTEEIVRWLDENTERFGFAPNGIEATIEVGEAVEDGSSPIATLGVGDWVVLVPAYGDGELIPEAHIDEVFRWRFEPAPGLVSSVEDYTNLPDRSILYVIDPGNGMEVISGHVLQIDDGSALVMGRVGWVAFDELEASGVACRVVEYGGTT